MRVALLAVLKVAMSSALLLVPSILAAGILVLPGSPAGAQGLISIK